MATEITGTYINISVRCTVCGYEWEYDDYDSVSVDMGIEHAKRVPCEMCKVMADPDDDS